MKEQKYYVAPATMPHQKGRWAVFSPQGAQIQGTVRDSKEEAQGIADNFNQKPLTKNSTH